ncbi:MAG TPA: PEP/pyruvate-binding domain-containing protein, partial [Pyrinomonadaceae bacterium]|nr:PEP/pyruvate-binding domain-containing protein [Pyrinomonadaceae bacterium]
MMTCRILGHLFCAIALLVALVSASAFGQMAQKPSESSNADEGITGGTTSKRFLSTIQSQADFDELARVYNAKTPYALPHVMFVIDRTADDKIYYVNSQMFRFHVDFANAQYLSLKRGEDFFKDVYTNDHRHLIVGTIAWQSPVKKFTFEFWEGDLVTPQMISETYNTIKKSFFADISFKPNSTRQEDASAKLSIPIVTADEISKNQDYLALNVAKGVGRFHVIDKLDDTVELGYNEILVLKEVPIDLPPVAGIIVSQPTSPLSHINLLAKGWNIPNAYIKNANELFRQFDGHWFEFETTLNGYKYEPCLKQCLDDKPKIAPTVYGRDQFKSPPSNLKIFKLASLSEMRAKDSIIYGSKAANLGEIVHSQPKTFAVPPGFAIPFVYYRQFMQSNGFFDVIDNLMDDQDFVHNPSVRRKKLDEFRRAIQNGKFDPKLRSEILAKWRTQLGGRPVYVRSSSNAEDAGNFSGAGLYSSVENVTEADKIIEAVKAVWASIWNFKAYEARERNFVNHDDTNMGVLIQVGVKMDDGGVMITKDPYDPMNKGAVYISATFGHNIAVTSEGVGASVGGGNKKAIPEQILFSPKADSIQILTRSDQQTMFVPDIHGGLKEVPFNSNRRILSDTVVRNLVRSADYIKTVF